MKILVIMTGMVELRKEGKKERKEGRKGSSQEKAFSYFAGGNL